MNKSPFKSRARGTVPSDLRLGLEILQADGEAATFKQEGGRFSHAPATVKMCAGEVYAFRVHVFPEEADLGPRVAVLHRPAGAGVGSNVEDDVKMDGNFFVWRCKGLAPCRKKDRVKMWVGVFVEGLRLDVPILIKVYKPGNKSARNGLPLKRLQVSFLAPSGSSMATVDKIVYL
mmetsp:Transcript_45041/g.143438  ORF Transcript_45041/g.143438 Transcript_45041/m.143438 type:complete len:175 (-) Transcript_45041:821-1345(-)